MAKQTVLIDTHNRITPKTLEDIIMLQVNSLKANPNIAHTMPPLMVWGSPGCGKSTIIRKCADAAGIGFIDFRLSQVEPVDLRGLPVPNKEDKSVEWFVTAEFPRDKNSRGILLFDEISAADRSLQVAAYELILDRRLGKLYNLPDGWLVIGAGNKVDDHAVSTTMSSALANRFMHVELETSSEDWLEWARANDLHPSVTGFIKYRDELLFTMKNQNLERGWPSPRSWERVSQMCKLCNNEQMLRNMVYGLVGDGAGVEFMTFHKLNKEFDDVLEMMTNPKCPIIIPKEADRLHAMCASMAYLVWKGKDKNETETRVSGFLRICIELTSDFAVMAMIAAKEAAGPERSNVLIPIMSKDPLFAKWAQKHLGEIKKYKHKLW